MNFFLKNKKGMILPMVIIFGILMTITGLIIYKFMGQHTTISYHMFNRLEAEYAAKAGIEYGLYRLRNNGVPDDGQPHVYHIDIKDPNAEQNPLKRRTVEVIITPDGKTTDNVRNKYKVSANVIYG